MRYLLVSSQSFTSYNHQAKHYILGTKVALKAMVEIFFTIMAASFIYSQVVQFFEVLNKTLVAFLPGLSIGLFSQSHPIETCDYLTLVIQRTLYHAHVYV